MPILLSTLLTETKVQLHNIPLIEDVKVVLRLLGKLGKLIVITDDSITIVHISYVNDFNLLQYSYLTSKIRYSVLFMGIGLALRKEFRVAYPGGCSFSERPIDIHIDNFQRMGACLSENESSINGNIIRIESDNVRLRLPSVTATENIIFLLTSLEKGQFHINNAAREPEIVDLCCCIRKYGICEIKGEGTEIITIKANKEKNLFKNDCIIEYEIDSDRIEVLTYLALAIVLKKKIRLRKVNRLEATRYAEIFSKLGYNLTIDKENIFIDGDEKINVKEKLFKIQSDYYPGFPTDGLPILAGLCCGCNIQGEFVDNVYLNRSSIVDELYSLGYNIYKKSSTEYVCMGDNRECSNIDDVYRVNCRDIRCGMGILIAGLASNKKIILDNIIQVKRGYEKIEEKLELLGADFCIYNGKGYLNLKGYCS